MPTGRTSYQHTNSVKASRLCFFYIVCLMRTQPGVMHHRQELNDTVQTLCKRDDMQHSVVRLQSSSSRSRLATWLAAGYLGMQLPALLCHPGTFIHVASAYNHPNIHVTPRFNRCMAHGMLLCTAGWQPGCQWQASDVVYTAASSVPWLH